MPIRRVQSKLQKHTVMIRDPFIKKHIPETKKFNGPKLLTLLNHHPTVFIKPDLGRGGHGIVRLRRQSENRIKVQWRNHNRVVQREDLMPLLHRINKSSSTYLMQRGINLARIHGRSFDIRVYMQKPKNDWIVSGKVARVAASGRFLTNYHQGAKPALVPDVLQQVFRAQPSRIRTMIGQIEQLSLISSQVLDARFPGVRELGVDIAVDRDGKLWLLEVNTSPACITFRLLPDKTMYHQILKHKRDIYQRYAK